MKISEYFNLNRKQNELDFVDIDYENDMPLFLDPYFLSIREDRWSQQANATLENFFQYTLAQFKNGDIEEARRNFRFTEPYETCLGLSKTGVKGKSIGDDDASELFQYILDSNALDDGLISSVKEIKIFVDNISHDKISDLCTNVIRKHLIEYTKSQCELYGIKLENGIATREYWDPENLEWTASYEEMLVINDKPILLVPKSIVCRKRGYYYDSEQYARHFVLNFLVSEESRLNTSLVKRKKLKSGEIKTSVVKEEVAKKYNAYSKGYLRKFTKQHPAFFESFKTSAKRKVSSLSNEDILENYSDEFYLDIIDRLITGFSEINPGTTEANKFHNQIIACMNFLFYPSLTNPVKEKEINQGRKRIDLSYNNAAEEGFFFNLQTVKDIPSAYIFVECKNYTKDVANPELDQLNGRFSPNRGKVGFMVFRTCSNEEVLFQRCADYYRDNKNLILPMQDKDFISILSKMKEDIFERTNRPQESFLNELAQKVILS
ncbi:hypothetical protein MOC70_08935 [Bacillus vallismortis]|uniref:hypothetical protein n=1 Tax=Bacillus vallismortis TaxID=72361 RepID=UPI002281605D|nr:hypothetical protein [Bacillus vallismortis]MCY8424741.1 hypothetical protein [Bacillus vallismortis]